MGAFGEVMFCATLIQSVGVTVADVDFTYDFSALILTTVIHVPDRDNDLLAIQASYFFPLFSRNKLE